MNTAEILTQGRAVLGIEFGSTRVKAVLITPEGTPVASGDYTWQDTLENGVWTYSLQQVKEGLAACYHSMKEQVRAEYGVTLRRIGAMGVSAMMHGYLPFDDQMRLLTPFRTWRNTITGPAAQALTELMDFNIPQRWSIAHLEQAVMNGEEHVKDIRFLTTLAGYVHWLLTGQKVLGVGDASGMFPIDSAAMSWDAARLAAYDAHLAGKGYPWKLEEILPKVLPAGAPAGTLSAEGAALLDTEGDLEPGCPLCPPEGDAGTGMTATNAVKERTGNVSAGTSIFAMVVLEKPLDRVHEEIDIVTTPTGKPVAMVHCNTCTSDLNAWAGLLRQAAELFGASVSTGEMYTKLFEAALASAPDADELISFNYFSGEPVTHTDKGAPMLTRRADRSLSLPAFMRAQIYSAVAALSIGMEILTGDEKVAIDAILGHGGLFKTPVVGQRLLAAALNVPVTVMQTAGEGGAWGMAVLAAYLLDAGGLPLEDYLAQKIFAGLPGSTLAPDAEETAGFRKWLAAYKACLPAERAVAEALA